MRDVLQLRAYLDTEIWLMLESTIDWQTAVRSSLPMRIPENLRPLLTAGCDVARHVDEQPMEWQQIIHEAQIDEGHVLLVGDLQLDVDQEERRVRVRGVTRWLRLRPGEVVPALPIKWTGLLALWMQDEHTLLLTLAPDPGL